jgi:hypothetical protein
MKHITVDVPYKNRGKARKWSNRMFGNPKGPDGSLKFHEMPWYCRHILNDFGDFAGARFYFKNPEDATMFALRWS